jgi:hypothetical protein
MNKETAQVSNTVVAQRIAFLFTCFLFCAGSWLTVIHIISKLFSCP